MICSGASDRNDISLWSSINVNWLGEQLMGNYLSLCDPDHYYYWNNNKHNITRICSSNMLNKIDLSIYLCLKLNIKKDIILYFGRCLDMSFLCLGLNWKQVISFVSLISLTHNRFSIDQFVFHDSQFMFLRIKNRAVMIQRMICASWLLKFLEVNLAPCVAGWTILLCNALFSPNELLTNAKFYYYNIGWPNILFSLDLTSFHILDEASGAIALIDIVRVFVVFKGDQ